MTAGVGASVDATDETEDVLVCVSGAPSSFREALGRRGDRCARGLRCPYVRSMSMNDSMINNLANGNEDTR